MASARLHQVASSSVVACKSDVVRSSSPLSCVVRLKPWWQMACQPLTTAVALPGLVSSRRRNSVFCQAVSTTPETETEAGTDAEPAPAALEVAEATEGQQRSRRPQLKNLMETLNREAVEAASKDKSIPDIKPGDVVQLRVEVAENKKRVSLLRGIVIAKHNSGINTTFRIRRILAGVGVEIVFPLYSPNIKEIKVIDHRKVRRAKLYYLRDKIARLSTC